jgi:DNA-binding PadR family transcriptional regulator
MKKEDKEMKQVGGLRMWILHVIDENGPSIGVEIMDNVQRHYDLQFQWNKDTHIHPHHKGNVQSKRLLPGSIYPMLKKMVSEGLITKQDDGKYDLTEDGQILVTNLFEHFQSSNEHMNRKTISIENSLVAMNWNVSYMEDMDKEKIAHHKESIELLIERLKKIKESLK